MKTLKFDPENTLNAELLSLTPKEAVRLGAELCAAVERAVGADGCHGGVWPGNITWKDGRAAVGPVNREGIADMSPDLLEFISPEQFWSGDSSPSSDVYSIALVLYTALNHGIKPYFKKAEDNGSEERAEALESRMKGESLPYPATAGRALGDVILKGASFRPEERYATPGQLRAALESLPEGADVPAAVPVVPLSDEEKRNMPSYRVDKDFEELEPEKPRRVKRSGTEGKGSHGRSSTGRMAAARLGLDEPSKTEQVMRTLVSGHAQEDGEAIPPAAAEPPESVPEAQESVSAGPADPAAEPPDPEPPVPAPPPPEPPKKKKRSAGEVDEDMDAEEFRHGGERKGRWIFPLILTAAVIIALIFLLRSCRESGAAPFPRSTDPASVPTENLIHPPVEETPGPGVVDVTPTPVVTEPVETPPVETTPPPTEQPTAPTFEIVKANVTWTQAKELAEQSGGHLATVRNGIQLQEVINLAEENGISFVWLGASRSTADEEWYYVTGEPLDFTDWDVGEPSGASGGVREDYLMLWYRANVGYWSYNDQRNDPISVLPVTYGGKIGYVIEYD